jgi:transcriptional regulator with XRE-family HTH domain
MPQSFGKRLTALREKRGLSQIELARLASVAPSTLNYLEHDIRSGEKLSLGIAKRLALALGVTLDHLAGTYDKEGK